MGLIFAAVRLFITARRLSAAQKSVAVKLLDASRYKDGEKLFEHILYVKNVLKKHDALTELLQVEKSFFLYTSDMEFNYTKYLEISHCMFAISTQFIMRFQPRFLRVDISKVWILKSKLFHPARHCHLGEAY